MIKRSDFSAGSLKPVEKENNSNRKDNWKRRQDLWNYLLRSTVQVPSSLNPLSSSLTSDEKFLGWVEENWGEWKRELVRRKMVSFPLLDPEIGEFILDLAAMSGKEREIAVEEIEPWILDEITDQELIELN